MRRHFQGGGKHKNYYYYFFFLLNKVNVLKENERISSFKITNFISPNVYNKYYRNNKKANRGGMT